MYSSSVITLLTCWSSVVSSMSDLEMLELRYEASDMFYHAYNAYIDNAWPADELMPLSCRGRFRGREPSRGDIDDAMGNFSLTLIDSLDMLVVLGDTDEFENAVKKVIDTVAFDTDVVVSVFETNIRIVGGLVSGHILSELLQTKHGVMKWYRGELLNMALDCANRLLPAFNSTTGLPYPRVNLKTGLRGLENQQVTCTACAGTMILEFAALSRLSGEPVYESKASKAMDVLWGARHRQSNLVGNVLNVNTGDWIRRDSGVGAGIDSYYEYVAKAYVLLGEDKYLERWHSHYSAVMKYLGTGPLMMDVHMHRPHTNSKHFVDALGAFWPGLQVLMGDLKPAIEQHEVLYQIMKRHNFLPEAVTADFQVHWGQHLLRPEFVESTYFLYKATRDPYYLEAGKLVLKSLQKHARVTCGYAAVKDVRTLQHEDRMDSFVITETIKYLYLLFTKEDESFLDISQFVFTTEAHLLPLSLARLSNTTSVPIMDQFWEEEEDEEVEYSMSCPSTKYLFPSHNTAHDGAASIRKPLESLVEDTCPTKKVIKRKLTAAEFQSTSESHQKVVRDMGITIIKLPDGRVQLLHTFANAKTPEDGEEGLLFMQEMIEMSKNPIQGTDSPPKQITFQSGGKHFKLQAGPAQFGKDLKTNSVSAKVVMANHVKACGGSLQNGDSMWGRIVVVERGDCMFVEKARVLQSLGAVGGIVMDDTEGTAAQTSPLFAMSGDGVDDVQIPMVFLFNEESKILMKIMAENSDLVVTLEEKLEAASDFVPSTQLPEAEDLDDSIITNSHTAEKFKSAVHSFMKKSAEMLDFKSKFGLGSSTDENKTGDSSHIIKTADKSHDLDNTFDDDIKSVSIDEDDETGEVIATTTKVVRGPDGKSTTIQTTERFFKGETLSKTTGTATLKKLDENSETYNNIAEDKTVESERDTASSETFKFSDQLGADTEDILISVRNILEEASQEEPELMAELAMIEFKDLFTVFKYLFSHSSSAEVAYRKLFDGALEFGAKKFVDSLLKIIPKSNNEFSEPAMLKYLKENKNPESSDGKSTTKKTENAP